jgi:hypothetical protein
MQTTYGIRWNFADDHPIDELTPGQAQQRANASELFTVAVGDPRRPDAVIEVNWKNDYVGVWFFDDRGRRATHYTFMRQDDTRMFMTEVAGWSYPDGAGRALNEANVINTFSYQTDGFVRRVIKDKVANEETVKRYADVDIAMNWEPVPSFGDWASVARYDRTESLGS